METSEAKFGSGSVRIATGGSATAMAGDIVLAVGRSEKGNGGSATITGGSSGTGNGGDVVVRGGVSSASKGGNVLLAGGMNERGGSIGDVEIEAARFSVEVEETITMMCENAELTAAETLVVSGNRIVLEAADEIVVTQGADSFDLVNLLRLLDVSETATEALSDRVAQLEALLETTLAQLAKLLKLQKEQT